MPGIMIGMQAMITITMVVVLPPPRHQVSAVIIIGGIMIGTASVIGTT